jgi:hypothetical protein
MAFALPDAGVKVNVDSDAQTDGGLMFAFAGGATAVAVPSNVSRTLVGALVTIWESFDGPKCCRGNVGSTMAGHALFEAVKAILPI